jgi:hypothetical protein
MIKKNNQVNIEYPLKVYINRHDSHDKRIILHKKNSFSKSEIDIKNPKNQMKSIF